MSKEKKTVYIAGKMRGVPYYNWPKFDAASGRLAGLGFNVLSPADMDREVGFDPCKLSEWDKLPDSFDLSAAIERDNAAIDKSDAIYVISDGISTSTGGMAEIERGMKAGKIILFDTMTDERILRVMGVPETNDCGEPDDITPVCRERERLAEALTLAFCVIAIAASVLYAIVRALLK